MVRVQFLSKTKIIILKTKEVNNYFKQSKYKTEDKKIKCNWKQTDEKQKKFLIRKLQFAYILRHI